MHEADRSSHDAPTAPSAIPTQEYVGSVAVVSVVRQMPAGSQAAEKLACAQTWPTATAGVQVPQDAGIVGPSGLIDTVPSHWPLAHCTPSVHAAPPDNDPRKSQAMGGPAGN